VLDAIAIKLTNAQVNSKKPIIGFINLVVMVVSSFFVNFDICFQEVLTKRPTEVPA